MVWKWDNTEPFGNSQPNENPSGLGSFSYNLRHPGQYADVEIATFYNYFRDHYHPDLGRYGQADPIGAAIYRDMAVRNLPVTYGVSSTLLASMIGRQPKRNDIYAYASANPLSHIDPTGLLQEPDRGGGGGPNLCPLISQTFLSLQGMGTLSTWLCVYDCNTNCPGKMEKIVVEVQWDVFPHTGCYRYIARPSGM